jgi:uncharacterized protein YhjY with autotransporter beta-barrel domain
MGFRAMEIATNVDGKHSSCRGLMSGLLLCLFTNPITAGASVSDPDLVDNLFEEYFLQPCRDGLRDPVNGLPAKGWSQAEYTAYNDAICSVYFSAGTFNSTDTFASTSNTGSIAAQSKTSDTVAQQQVDSVQDRLDELMEEEPESGGGWGLLLSAQKGETERVSTNDEVGYDSDLDGVVIGGDYRFDNSLVVGVAVGNTTDDASFDGGGGSLETESQSVMGYFTYVLSDNAYIDGYFGVAPLDYSSERDVSVDGEAADNFGFTGIITSEFEGDQTLYGISGGYDWYPSDFSYGVFGALDYSETDIDDYVEEGTTGLELIFPDQSSESMTLTLGVTGSYTIDMGWGVLVPNVSISAVHEEENDSRSFDARLVVMPAVDTSSYTLETDSPDRDYMISSIGVVIALNSGAQFFATYEQLSSHDFLESSAYTVGFLTEF